MKSILPFLVLALVSGCSTKMVALATPMTMADDGGEYYRLENAVKVDVTHAAPVYLKPGTIWQQVGTIEAGNVFDTKDQVVIINSFDVHEAAIVSKDGVIIGFYLLAQKTFVEADPVPVTLLKED